MSLNESYAAIRLPFLFDMSITLSEFPGDSTIIFIKMDKISSVKQLRRRFLSEKLHSADAVEMEIDKHMVAS